MSPGDPDRMMAAVAASMKKRTGRSLEEWVALVEVAGPDALDQVAVRRWLRDEHGVPQNSQWAIADAAARASGWVPPTLEEYIEEQYQGAKEALRPTFDLLRETIEALGDDVRTEGRATYIPFVRRRQFAAVKAATRTRVDVGLRYTDPPDSELLRPADSPGQTTHRLSVTAADEVGDEVLALLRTAYEQNG
jgi:predicted transport protein